MISTVGSAHRKGAAVELLKAGLLTTIGALNQVKKFKLKA